MDVLGRTASGQRRGCQDGSGETDPLPKLRGVRLRETAKGLTDVPLLQALADGLSLRPTPQAGGAEGGAVEREENPVAAAVPLAAGAVAGDIRALVCSRPWPCDPALTVAYCESRYRADAVGDGSYGLWQIQASTWADFMNARGFDFWNQWSDPAVNTEMAWIIYERAGGFWPWSCWR